MILLMKMHERAEPQQQIEKNKTKIGWMKNQVTVFTAWPLTGQNQLRYEEDFTRLSKICCFAYNANQHCRTYNTDRPLKEIT